MKSALMTEPDIVVLQRLRRALVDARVADRRQIDGCLIQTFGPSVAEAILGAKPSDEMTVRAQVARAVKTKVSTDGKVSS